MTVTIETAALADVIERAARVAPNKGAAYDKAAGVVFEFDPAEVEPITIKSTDMEVTFLEKLTPLEVDDKMAFTWRIPSALFAGIMGNLPLGSSTKLSEKNGALWVACGKAKAKIRMYAPPLINFEPFDPTTLEDVPGFAARVSQVAWACDKNSIPFTGVHIDGKRLVATDRYRLATVPLDVPVDEPITVPLEVLNFVSKGAVDAALAAAGKRLHVMLSNRTQITSVIYDAKYPAVERAMFDDYPDECTCTVDRDALKTGVSRMLVLVKGERYPLMKLTIGKERLHILMDVPEVGEMEDEIPVVGADHDDFEILFTPTNFVDGVSHAGKPTVTFKYDRSKPLKNVLFDDDDGYRCWVVPRHPVAAESDL